MRPDFDSLGFNRKWTGVTARGCVARKSGFGMYIGHGAGVKGKVKFEKGKTQASILVQGCVSEFASKGQHRIFGHGGDKINPKRSKHSFPS